MVTGEALITYALLMAPMVKWWVRAVSRHN